MTIPTEISNRITCVSCFYKKKSKNFLTISSFANVYLAKIHQYLNSRKFILAKFCDYSNSRKFIRNISRIFDLAKLYLAKVNPVKVIGEKLVKKVKNHYFFKIISFHVHFMLLK